MAFYIYCRVIPRVAKRSRGIHSGARRMRCLDSATARGMTEDALRAHCNPVPGRKSVARRATSVSPNPPPPQAIQTMTREVAIVSGARTAIKTRPRTFMSRP
jgi:hypothetical protein